MVHVAAGDDMEVLISSTSDEITGGGKAKGRVEIRATNIEHFYEHLALVFEMRPKNRQVFVFVMLIV